MKTVDLHSTTKHRSGEDNLERALFWLFLAGLAWVPFYFGSNDLLAWGINAVFFPSLAMLYELSRLVWGRRHFVGMKFIWLPAILFLAVVLWIVVQNATWTPQLLHHPMWRMAADALERPIEGSISVNRDLTMLALVRLVTAASVFWLAFQLCRDASRARLLLYAVAVIGCAYATYGLMTFAVSPGHVLWVKSPFSGGVVTSTFINRNSFATYAGIGFITLCGLMLTFYRDEMASGIGGPRFRIAAFMDATGRMGAVLIGGAFLVLVALLLTQSRGGVLATGIALLVLCLLMFGRRKRGFGNLSYLIAFGVVIAAAVFLSFGDSVAGRITREGGLYDGSRVAVYTIVLRSIGAAPLLGYGYGTFMDVFPMFRDRSTEVVATWENAHNTYVEVFQGLGLVGGSMLLGSILLLVLKCLQGAFMRRDNVIIPSIAVAVSVLVGMHALVDFSLQMQAVALTFIAIVGAGVAQSRSSRFVLND